MFSRQLQKTYQRLERDAYHVELLSSSHSGAESMKCGASAVVSVCQRAVSLFT